MANAQPEAVAGAGGLTVSLPLPPPLNNLFANVAGKGRVRSAVYNRWRRDAMTVLMIQRPRPIHGDVVVAIQIPRTTRGDVDGRIKAILDILVAAAITDDDKHVDSVSIARADVAETIVTILPAKQVAA